MSTVIEPRSNRTNVDLPCTTPVTGMMIGSAISLLLWALLLAIVFAIR